MTRVEVATPNVLQPGISQRERCVGGLGKTSSYRPAQLLNLFNGSSLSLHLGFGAVLCLILADGKMAIILPTEQWYAPSAVINDAWYGMVLHGFAWYSMVLHYLALSCAILHYLVLSCTILHYLALS